MHHRLRTNIIALLLLLQVAPAMAGGWDALPASGEKSGNRRKSHLFRLADEGEMPGEGIRIAPFYGRYAHHLSGPEIYMWRINHGYNNYVNIKEVQDQFGSMQHFVGLQLLGSVSSNNNFFIEFGYITRYRKTDATFKYVTLTDTLNVITRREETKLTFNNCYFGLRAPLTPKFNRLQLGFTIDLGLMRAKIRTEENDGGKSKWGAWFYNFKLFGDGVVPRTPVAGLSALAEFHLTDKVAIRVTRMFPILDGEMNSETNKYTNIPWSSKKFPIANTLFSLQFGF